MFLCLLRSVGTLGLYPDSEENVQESKARSPGGAPRFDMNICVSYFNVNFFTCTSRLLGPIIASNSPGSQTNSRL